MGRVESNSFHFQTRFGLTAAIFPSSEISPVKTSTFPRTASAQRFERERSRVDKHFPAEPHVCSMKFVTYIRLSIIVAIATGFAACATPKGGSNPPPGTRGQSGSKDYGWQRTKWINT